MVSEANLTVMEGADTKVCKNLVDEFLQEVSDIMNKFLTVDADIDDDNSNS